VNRRTLGCLLELGEAFVVILVILVITQFFVAAPYQVQRQAMENTLAPGQYVLVDKLSPQFDQFHRGDIVVFNPPSGSAKDQSATPDIQRVVGIGGDTVDIHGGHLYINGSQATETYVAQTQTTDLPGGGAKTWKLTTGQLFVLVDNRTDRSSRDSRDFGPIEKSSVIGRALMRYWPLGKFGVISPAAQSPASGGSPAASTAP
jgi:signal peptidase I